MDIVTTNEKQYRNLFRTTTANEVARSIFGLKDGAYTTREIADHPAIIGFKTRYKEGNFIGDLSYILETMVKKSDRIHVIQDAPEKNRVWVIGAKPEPKPAPVPAKVNGRVDTTPDRAMLLDVLTHVTMLEAKFDRILQKLGGE